MKDIFLKPKVIVPVFVMAVLITAAGIYFHQNFFRIIPLYISLFVMILSASVSRYAYLVGGLNSILYAVVYFYYGIYGVAAQALLFSFPMQIITFFNWKKNADKQAVVFKKMTARQRIGCVIIFAAAWAVLYFVLKRAGSQYAFLDNTASLIGVLISVLTAMTYIEYTWLMIPSGILTIALHIQVIPDNPEQTTYLIYSIYSLVCITIQFFNARKIHRSQMNADNNSEI